MSAVEWDLLTRVPLASLKPGDVVHLPQRVASLLTYDPPVTISGIILNASGSIVLTFERWEQYCVTEYLMARSRLYVSAMVDDPAVIVATQVA